jgi:hypothetical protein
MEKEEEESEGSKEIKVEIEEKRIRKREEVVDDYNKRLGSEKVKYLLTIML